MKKTSFRVVIALMEKNQTRQNVQVSSFFNTNVFAYEILISFNKIPLTCRVR